MVAVTREALDYSVGDGSVMDPLLWDRASKPEDSRTWTCLALQGFWSLPGLPWTLGLLLMRTSVLGPFLSLMLVKFTAFLSTLRWPKRLNEMGKFGISDVETLFLFERWVGRCLLPEKTVPAHHRAGRNLSLCSCPVSEGVQIRVSCKFLGSMFRSLAQMPGGLARFLPCGIGMSGSGTLVGFSVGMASLLGPWNPVFLVALIPCWIFLVAHQDPPLLGPTAPFALNIVPPLEHHGFLPGLWVWVVERVLLFPSFVVRKVGMGLNILFLRKWMMARECLEGVLLVRPLFGSSGIGRLADLPSEGNGCTCLDHLEAPRKTVIFLALEWAGG